MSSECTEYIGLRMEKEDLEIAGSIETERYKEIEERMSELWRDLSASERELYND